MSGMWGQTRADSYWSVSSSFIGIPANRATRNAFLELTLASVVPSPTSGGR